MRISTFLLWTALLTFSPKPSFAQMLTLQDGDRVTLLGGTFIEREAQSGFIETYLTLSNPDKTISFRNLGWSADTVWGESRGYFKPEEGYNELLEKTKASKPTLIILAYGANEAWAGEEGLERFIEGYTRLIDDLMKQTQARVILMSTPRQENLGKPFPDPAAYNQKLERYFKAVGELAADKRLMYIDLFSAMSTMKGLTSNSLHLNDKGYRWVAEWLSGLTSVPGDDILVHVDSKTIKAAQGDVSIEVSTPEEVRFHYRPYRLGDLRTPRSLNILGMGVGLFEIRADGRLLLVADDDELAQGISTSRLLANERLLQENIKEKNAQYFYSWRPQNTTYLFGFRKHEQGRNNKELTQFEAYVKDYEARIATLKNPASIEWTITPVPNPSTPDVPDQPASTVLPPDEELKTLKLPDDLQVNVFASEPEIVNPTHMNWDADGRLWIACAPGYPQIKPGYQARDQIVVLEDTDHDGQADTRHLFVDDALLPTAVLPGNGGVYVANSTELVHYRDTDGDMKADEKTVILSGFGTEDTHHIIHTLTWGEDGMLYFNQSIYIHSHVETPWGVERLMAGGIWQFDPNTHALKVFARGMVNPWGHQMDSYGRSFATDGAGSSGINYIFPGVALTTAYGTRHIYPGLNPGQPKLCGLDIISGNHFPEAYQGVLVANDFRGHRTVSFKLDEIGSGFVSTQLKDIITVGDGKLDRMGRGGGFRPIDVKMGPDGALYLADWSNIIIQHGEVDFRDERRDRSHGRIWRITAKERALDKRVPFSQLATSDLLDTLDSSSRYQASSAKRVLIERGEQAVMPELTRWLGQKRSDYQKLQALWLLNGLHKRNPFLLKALLESESPRIRAAAVRVSSLAYRDLPELLYEYKKTIADPHPLVRMETIHALRSMGTVAAVETALLVLDGEMDSTLDYSLMLTINELAPVWIGKARLTNINHLLYAARASKDPVVVEHLYEALRDGQVPETDMPVCMQLISEFGNPQQLDFLYSKLFDTSVPVGMKRVILDGLKEAAVKRRIKPSQDEAKLSMLLASPDLRSSAMALIGSWQVKSLSSKVVELARQGDVDAIRAIGGLRLDDAEKVLGDIVSQAPSPEAETAALESLIRLNDKAAIPIAVKQFQSPTEGADYGPVFDVLFQQRQTYRQLIKALEGQIIDSGIALIGGRHASMMGLSSSGLIEALYAAGHLKPMNVNMNPQELQRMVSLVQSDGDPHLGEAVYRRPALACVSCHAIGGAGPEIGPDLISIGASAPVDYLITSILDPSDKIKEGYHLTTLELKNGNVIAGAELSANKEEVVIRTASGVQHVIAQKDIKSRQVSPASMMPPGLTASLSEQEFVHLVSFLSQLGKEGDFKLPADRFIRSFKVLDEFKNEYWDDLNAQPWRPGYARVNGFIPLKDGSVFNAYDPAIKLDFKVLKPGRVTLKFSAVKSIRAYTANQEWVRIDPDTGMCRFIVDQNNSSLVILLKTRVLPGEISIQVVEDDTTAVIKLP